MKGSNPSERDLKRLIEVAVSEECELSGRGLWFCVGQIETVGFPPERLRVWATLHFLPSGSPFCCGEPECHLSLIERGAGVGERVRRAMGLHRKVVVDFGDRIGVNYHEGVSFKHS